VTRIPLLKNWNFSPPFSRLLDTVLSRYNKLLNLQHRPLRPTKNPPRLHSYLTPREHTDSAECWLNTTSKMSLYHQGKIYSYLPPVKDALGLRMPGVNSM